MGRFRNFLTLTLVVSVLATAIAMGAARGQARVAGEIIICSGTGITSQPVDSDGNPVGKPMFCPDCALTLMGFADTAEPRLAIKSHGAPQEWLRPPEVRPQLRPIQKRQARAPPRSRL